MPHTAYTMGDIVCDPFSDTTWYEVIDGFKATICPPDEDNDDCVQSEIY